MSINTTPFWTPLGHPKGFKMAIKLSDYTTTKHSGLKVHKDGITFLFDIRVDGKRTRKQWKSKPSHTKGDRLKIANLELEKFKEKVLHQYSIVADMEATVLDYWIKLKATKNWKLELESKYEYYYSKHLYKFSKLKIKDIKPAHFTSLNVSLNHLAPRTQKKAYEILQPLFALAVEDEIIDKSPIKKSHIPVRKQIEEKKIITNAEEKYRIIYQAINQLFGSEDIIKIDEDRTIKCHSNPHHKALFLFGFHGRRRGEVVNLNWEDISFDTDTYIVRGENSKVNTDMVFALPQDVKEALSQFQSTTGKVFNVSVVYKHYPKIRLITGIEEFSFHWMRNLAVSALSSIGAGLTHLTAMLGHTDSSTLKKYLSLQREASTTVTNELSTRLLSEK